MKRIFENYIVAIRWLLIPFIVMLNVGLIGVMLNAGRNTIQLLRAIFQGGHQDLKVALLEMVDLTLIGALVVIVVISVYVNFVSQIKQDTTGMPSWMTTVDFTQLKLKILTAIVVISAVRLLELFMEVPKVDDRDLIFYIALHVTLVFSRLAMGFSSKNA